MTPTVVAIRVAGNVDPDSAPTVELLDLARAYFRLLVKDSEVSFDAKLDLVGLKVEKRCASVEAVTHSPGLARDAIVHAAAYARGDLKPPRGTAGYVADLRAALAEVTSRGYGVRMMVGEEWAMKLKPEYIPAIPVTSETGTWRAYVEKLGGVEPRIKVSVRGLGRFSMAASREIVSAMHAYTYADITARIDRDAEGVVSGGEVFTFRPVESTSGAEAFSRLQQWFRANSWSSEDFASPEQALGRDE